MTSEPGPGTEPPDGTAPGPDTGSDRARPHTPHDSATSVPEPNVLERERRRLIDLAYRLLGSLAEAEDAVQETYTRWYAMSPQQQAAIASPAAWLTKVAGRVCLDLLGSARARRERYVGEWLPEPVPSAAAWTTGHGESMGDPADRVTLDESITMAFLVVLEAMTPAERVAFVLHDVFGYPFADVAEVVGRTPAACRQLASSARRRLRSSQPPAPSVERHAAVVRTFKQAWEAKDVRALVAVLDPEAVAVSDGGGVAQARLTPVVGGEEIARFFLEIARLATDLTLRERIVNGRPGLVAERDGRIVTVYAFELAADRIRRIWAVRNPEKLRAWTDGARS